MNSWCSYSWKGITKKQLLHTSSNHEYWTTNKNIKYCNGRIFLTPHFCCLLSTKWNINFVIHLVIHLLLWFFSNLMEQDLTPRRVHLPHSNHLFRTIKPPKGLDSIQTASEELWNRPNEFRPPLTIPKPTSCKSCRHFCFVSSPPRHRAPRCLSGGPSGSW